MGDNLTGPERAALRNPNPPKAPTGMALSEMFGPVIQGEGFSAGHPCIFLRTQGCNFLCGLHNGTGVGKIGPDGKEITWWCDSEVVWKAGREYSFDEIIQWMKDSGEWYRIMTGQTHIILSGGEPTMHHNAIPALALFKEMERRFYEELNSYSRDQIDRMHADSYAAVSKYLGPVNYSLVETCIRFPIVEVETNGSIDGPHVKELFNYVSQINCSAKLANSGMPLSMRVRRQALDLIISHPNHWWKFVVSDDKDWDEIMEDYAHVFGPEDSNEYRHLRERSRIILMPAGSSTPELKETCQKTWEMATKHNVRYCDRYQVRVWEMATGV